MASASEQLGSGFNWSSITQSKDLRNRILFTLAGLIVYRLGTYIPIPGINVNVLNSIFAQKGSGLLGMFNTFSGGALRRMTLLALSIMPYISASIIMQLLTTIVPSMVAIKKEGEVGRKLITQYTRYLTVLIAALQAFGIAIGLEHGDAAIHPGPFFILNAVVCMVGGTMFLMWLGEQITQRGIGNGTSLIIYSGIIANLPRALASLFEFGSKGTLKPLTIAFICVMVLVVIYGVVFFERSYRKVFVQYPKRQRGRKMMDSSSSHIPLKLNTSGVIPPIFASALLLVPGTALSFIAKGGSSWLSTASRYIQVGSPGYLLAYSILIIFFAFFYTSITFNPDETSENLRKNGGFIAGIRPGKMTSEYFDFVLTRLTVIGAIYLVIVCLIPQVLMKELQVPFYFGGTSLLIVVSVTMDTISQIHSHIIAKQYEGLMKKNKFKGIK